MSVWLATQAWGELLYMDLVGLAGFSALRRSVKCVTRRPVDPQPEIVPAVEDAMKTAVALYFRHAKCLQRSAAVARLLRRRGIQADVVIGCHLAPLSGHAWVEVDGEVVSDYQTGLEFMQVVERW